MRQKWNPSEPQLMALEHLRKHDQAALFMGCGLGKTSVVLHRLHELFCDGACKGALIVAPLRVANLTWPAELGLWESMQGIRFRVLTSACGRGSWVERYRLLEKGDADIWIVNYEGLLPMCRNYFEKNPKSVPFDTVVFDELTRAKGHSSKNINSIRPYLGKYCKRIWGLTGTPTPNSLMELFAQIRLIDNGIRLGRSFNSFRDHYFRQVSRYKWVLKNKAEHEITTAIKDIALTIKSSDWLDVPETHAENHDIQLPAGPRTTYNDLEVELIHHIEGGESLVAANTAVLANKLLQVTGGACYLPTTPGRPREWVNIHDKKLQELARVIKSFEGRPCMVSYQFQHELHRLKQMFPEIEAWSDALTDTDQRALARLWNEGRIPILAAHPRSISHGVNLQFGGSDLIWYTMPWSREDYDQMIARLVRRGQNKEVTVHHLVVEDSIDEAVLECLRRRGKNQEDMLDSLKDWSAVAKVKHKRRLTL